MTARHSPSRGTTARQNHKVLRKQYTDSRLLHPGLGCGRQPRTAQAPVLIQINVEATQLPKAPCKHSEAAQRASVHGSTDH
jgi:hypothetical protein